MNPKLQNVLQNFVRKPGASQSDINQVLASLKVSLPNDYLEAQSYANGSEGFVGGAYLRLYPVTELAALNKAYVVEEFAPGLMIFGSSGGGEAFAFDISDHTISIIQIPFIPMDRQYAINHGPTLWDLMKSLAERSGEPINSNAYKVNPSTLGKEIHEILPIVFGGNPTDRENKALLEPTQYAEYVVWWNRRYTQMIGHAANNPKNM